MVKFTLLELHLEESDFTATATAPFGPGEKDVEAGGEPPEATENAGPGKGAAIGAVVGLVFLVLVAYAAKRRLLGDEAAEEPNLEFDA